MSTRRDVEEFYTRRYTHPPGSMRDYRTYLRTVGARTGGRLLDIGCGEGFLLRDAEQVGLDPFGVEIAPNAVALARARTPSAGLARAAGEALPFRDAAFDVVMCLGSLEHFLDPAVGISEVARVLRPDGVALLVVPNADFIVWRLRGSGGTEQQEAQELLLDLTGWRTLIERRGLRVARVEKEPWHTKPAGFWTRTLRTVARAVIPLRWTYQFSFVCRRAT
ncbi:MAG: class I SAM-dependent methyltransferase [Gemmatimonadota bacterium]